VPHRLGVCVDPVPPPRGTSHRSPSRLSPRDACRPCRAVLARIELPRGPSHVPCAHASQCSAVVLTTLMLGILSYEVRLTSRSLAIKAARRAASRTPQRPQTLPVRRRRGGASSGQLRRRPTFPVTAQALPEPTTPLLSLPRPRAHRSRARCGRGPYVPPPS
jgi:hypothetical protein